MQSILSGINLNNMNFKMILYILLDGTKRARIFITINSTLLYSFNHSIDGNFHLKKVKTSTYQPLIKLGN